MSLGKKIPNNLDEALEYLKRYSGERFIDHVLSIKEKDFEIESHFSIGKEIRNSWKLWEGSKLSQWFNDRNIYHPDDMSGIIITSFHRKLHNKDINLDEQIKVYIDYWTEKDEMKTMEKLVNKYASFRDDDD